MIAERTAARPAASTFGPALSLMTGRTIGFVAAFCIPVVLARVFAPEEFGTYKQLFLIAATLFALWHSMAESLYYFLPLGPREGARYATNAALALAVGGLVCLGALVVMDDTVAGWLNNAALARYAGWLGVYVCLTLASASLEIVMIARGRFTLAAGAYAALDLCRAALLVIPPLLAADLGWLMAGAVAFAAIRCVVTVGYFAWEFGRALEPDRRLLRAQLAYAMPFQLAGIVEIVQTTLHQYVVAYRFDAAAFAVYSVGCLQIPLVELITASVLNVMMVRMAEEIREGRPAAAVTVWHDSARKLALVFCPMVVLLGVTAHPLIVLLFTETYAASVPIFIVSSFALLLPMLAVDGVLRVYAETRALLVLQVIRLALTAILIGWCVAQWGLVGAMLATVAAAAVTKILGVAWIGRRLGVGLSHALPWRELAGILLVAVAAGIPAGLPGALDLPPLLSLLSAGALYGAAYVAALWLVPVLNAEERTAVRGWLARRSPALARPARAGGEDRGLEGGA
jgi:O-antigen/teichoic acid export membrane protein